MKNNILKRVILFFLNPALIHYRQRIRKMSHQRQDEGRTRKKWQLIEQRLPASVGSLLDIGCNEGYFTRRAAEAGWFAWGIDTDQNAIDYAARTANEEVVECAHFSRGALTPSGAEALPEFDVILLLSSFHEIMSAYGKDRAYRIFDRLLAKCQVLIFEPASANSRYNQSDDVFGRDNDRDSIQQWVQSLADRSGGCTVAYIGATDYTNEEPQRFMFSISRNPVGVNA